MATAVLGRDVPLNMRKVAIAAAVGGASSLAAVLDGRKGWERSFRRSQDWLHLGIMGAGVYGLMKGKLPEVLETAVYVDTGFLTRSLLSLVAPAIASKVGGREAVSEAERILLQARHKSSASARDKAPVGQSSGEFLERYQHGGL